MTVTDPENKTATGECAVAVKTTLGVNQRIAGALRESTATCPLKDSTWVVPFFNTMGRAPPF